jgi:rfaE bifunctional protein kinase chain/domain
MITIQEAIENFKKIKIAVIGDVMLDRYTFGTVDRVSPEAPVPVILETSEKFTLGGAGNVANNLAALGATVFVAGMVGEDEAGLLVKRQFLERNINVEALAVFAHHPTTEKHRIVSEDNHQFLRLDREEKKNLTLEEENSLYDLIVPAVKQCDAVIFSDYAKGFFSEQFARKVVALAKTEKKIMLADFNPKHKSYFMGVDIVTPNLKEARELSGLQDIEEIGPWIVREMGVHAVVTRGGEGMSLFQREDASHHYVPGKKIRVFDVSGAGDTSIAVLALGIAVGLDIKDAVMLANEAGTIVVQKPGTATLSPEELMAVAGSSNRIENIAIVPKVWGYEQWIQNNEKYCCKILGLNKGYQCSLHYHKNKDETFIVTSGHVRMELGGEVTHLRPGSFVRVPPNTPHRFAGIEDSLIMEVSTHHEDSDSYRIEESRKMDEDIA